jgi:hypothetical protein
MSHQTRIDTQTATKENEPIWGDLMQPNQSKCRVLFNNIQGLAQNGKVGNILEIGQATKDNNVSILGMCGTNKDWRCQGTKWEITQHFRKFWSDSVYSVSSSMERFGKAHQPGGTMTVVGGA